MSQQGMERMQRMDQMMDRGSSGNRRDREQLMTEHMGLMMEHMKEMGGMMGHGKGADANKPVPRGEQLSMMGDQMQMMQQMMAQMLRHQEMMMKMMDD